MTADSPDPLKVGSIVIQRNWSIALSARRFLVLVDGRKFGHVAIGEKKEFFVEPGSHHVAVKCDQAKTPELPVEIVEGHRTLLTCGPQSLLGALNPLNWLDSSTWLFIKRMDGSPATEIIDELS